MPPRRRRPGPLATHGDASQTGLELPREQLDERAFARAIVPHQAGDSPLELPRNVVESDHRIVPLADGVEAAERGRHVTTFTARTCEAMTAAETIHIPNMIARAGLISASSLSESMPPKHQVPTSRKSR